MRRIATMVCSFGWISISAGEIVSWKVPFESYAAASAPTRRLEKPPEASPFFQAGDELWDAGLPRGSDRAEDGPGVEWAVWNETSGALVTKGGMDSVWRLRRSLGLDRIPHQIRTLVEVFATPADGVVGADARPAASLEWLSKSGMKSSASREEGGNGIDMEAELSASGDKEAIQGRLVGTFHVVGQQPMKLDTRLELKSGSPVWAASDRDGPGGIAVRVTAQVVLSDGSPFADAIRIEKDGKAVPVVHPGTDFEKHRIGGKSWLCLASIPIDVFPQGREGQSAVDPFREDSDEERIKLAGLQMAEIPKPIAGWFNSPVLDLRESMRATGINVEDGRDFAGFDRVRNEVILFTSSDIEADKLEQLSVGGCHLPTKMSVVSCDGYGQSQVLVNLGSRALVTRIADDKSERRRFEVEPTLNENDELVDLKVAFNDRPSSDSSVVVNTSVILANGRPLEVQAGGAGRPVTLKAVITHPMGGQSAGE